MEWARSHGVRIATKECLSEFIDFYARSESPTTASRSDATIKQVIAALRYRFCHVEVSVVRKLSSHAVHIGPTYGHPTKMEAEAAGAQARRLR